MTNKITFPESTPENKAFIQAVARHELKYDFSIAELEVFLKDEDDNFICHALDTYDKSAFSNLDTYDRYVVGTIIFEKMTGLPFDASCIHIIPEIVMSDKQWLKLLYDREELHKRQENMFPLTRTMSIKVDNYPDLMKISAPHQYLDGIVKFLKENSKGLEDSIINSLQTPESILSREIFDFIGEFAEIKADFDPDFDDEDEKFASPDASVLFAAATILKSGKALPKDFSLHSSWESGGYSPYTSEKGKKQHDEIIIKLSKLIKKD